MSCIVRNLNWMSCSFWILIKILLNRIRWKRQNRKKKKATWHPKKKKKIVKKMFCEIAKWREELENCLNQARVVHNPNWIIKTHAPMQNCSVTISLVWLWNDVAACSLPAIHDSRHISSEFVGDADAFEWRDTCSKFTISLMAIYCEHFSNTKFPIYCFDAYCDAYMAEVDPENRIRLSSKCQCGGDCHECGV